ncbi:MAG: tRNA (N6-isopentenyl adenosine(37)-C2)-methylthiotransferase MiaB [Bacteroidia bacterium]|nr:MAG: tRNA (N6-isopentenyl adenosine(37)-C2)-methylthiotransferase MiaB [Bacteroidia bacterium]
MEKLNVYIETYGCQMNVNDSEVVASVLVSRGCNLTPEAEAADLVVINTCAIRENAEVRILGRIGYFRALRAKTKPGLLIALIGCMAERLKEELLDPAVGVDIVVGPDAYRELPELVELARRSGRAINTQLSRTETYSDIEPLRFDGNGISAFTSIMRGCDNMCTYCVVPYTRGRERSRGPESIIREVRQLSRAGYREVTLLGQNVDSYLHRPPGSEPWPFARLLGEVATAVPGMRVRFATSHPKDITEEVLQTMARHENICRHIHLPFQSGSNAVLKRMRRTYTRELYLEKVESIRRMLPGCAITTDIIAGFCGETDADHRATLSLMEEVVFDGAFMFMYSERPGTYAAKHLPDDVPEPLKNARLQEIIARQNEASLATNQRDVGREFSVLVEGPSKRNAEEFCGRTSQNRMVVFPRGQARPGDYVRVVVDSATQTTLRAHLQEERAGVENIAER